MPASSGTRLPKRPSSHSRVTKACTTKPHACALNDTLLVSGLKCGAGSSRDSRGCLACESRPDPILLADPYPRPTLADFVTVFDAAV